MAKKKPGITLTSPITREDHLPALNAVIDACGVTDEACRRCDECSIDVDNAKLTNDDLKKIAEAIKRVYFPDAP